MMVPGYVIGLLLCMIASSSRLIRQRERSGHGIPEGGWGAWLRAARGVGCDMGADWLVRCRQRAKYKPSTLPCSHLPRCAAP
eukprot:1175741-Pyramimonas_sp.AAC.1